MLGKLKSCMFLFVMVLTLCGFAMPVFCHAAHAHTDVSSQPDHQHAAKKTDFSKDQKSGKSSAHGNCCLGHHCCAAKLVIPVEFALLRLSLSDAVQIVSADQHVSSFHLSSLDRPPKHLV